MSARSADSGPTAVHPDALELAELLRPAWPQISARLHAAGGPVCDGTVLTSSVRELNQQIAQARETAGERWTAFEQARQALASSGHATEQTSAEFRAAEQASQAYTQAAEAVSALEDTRERLMGIASSDMPGNGNGPQDGDPRAALTASGSVNREQVQALTATPGMWLASTLERRKRDVPTISEDLRVAPAAAALGQITTANVSTQTEGEAVIDLLAPQSVVFASGVTVLRIDTTKTRVPRFTDLPVAGWIPELAPFPKSAPGIEMVDVEPPKVGLVTPLSLEVFQDLRPLTLAMLQTQILRAIALEYDRGILWGSGAGAIPRGIANTPGIAAITGIDLYNLAAFAEAIAVLIASNARPGVLVMNPLDVGTLLKLTEAESGAGSNVPLWQASINSPSGLRLPFFGLPIWPTPAAPRGSALCYDPATIIAVLRRELDLALDPYYGFDTGEVGFRAYLRGDVVVGQGAGTALILFGKPATAAAATDVVTATGHRFINGDALAFSDITGGAPLTANTTYYARDVSGATFKVAATANGAAIDITSDMTAGRVRRV
jgi:HK97 family phage major capsid protein